jgi:glucosyl-dolichyl phosphate glucuronosyltransferase
MKITVIICTWNRANLLRQTLDRMLSLQISNGLSWELLVVNNNSTDHTDELIKDFAEKLPLRRLFEERPGKSNALNLAIREAQGDLILYTDDDVLVDPDWVSAYAAAAKQWPDASFFGGPINPWFEGDPPIWLKEVYPRVEIAFAARNLGPEPRILTEETLPFGANLAIRTLVQHHYLYDSNLGPKPNSELRGEETAVLRQMIRDGLQGRWVPGAEVKHHIPKKRQTLKYLRSFYRGSGRFCSMSDGENPAKIFGKPRWALRKAVKNEVLFHIKRFFGKPTFWIDNFILANTSWGYFIQPDSIDDSQSL